MAVFHRAAVRAACVFLLLVPLAAPAQPVVTEISGVQGDMRATVEASLSLKQAEQLEQVSVWRLRRMARDARDEVAEALDRSVTTRRTWRSG